MSSFGISSFQGEVHGCLQHLTLPVYRQMTNNVSHLKMSVHVVPQRQRKVKYANRSMHYKMRVCKNMRHTSPHPLAEVTRLKAKLIVPPPFPLWVDKEPDKMAVSFVVRGACNRTHKAVSPLTGTNSQT